MAIATFVSFRYLHLYRVLTLLCTPMQIQVSFVFLPLYCEGFSPVFEVPINLCFRQILIPLLRIPGCRALIKYIKGHEAEKGACEEGGVHPIHGLL